MEGWIIIPASKERGNRLFPHRADEFYKWLYNNWHAMRGTPISVHTTKGCRICIREFQREQGFNAKTEQYEDLAPPGLRRFLLDGAYQYSAVVGLYDIEECPNLIEVELRQRTDESICALVRCNDTDPLIVGYGNTLLEAMRGKYSPEAWQPITPTTQKRPYLKGEAQKERDANIRQDLQSMSLKEAAKKNNVSESTVKRAAKKGSFTK